ncbi:LysR family transcriptional regulator substrate-binding protein [Nocardia sp. NPDC051787]|uniref:LysR family transcriptional regulator substrate-binding protein n=1 Tax=Nocardia sp. NPDC051787 TaxID=3155415 RepID=UPI00343A143F
MAAHSPLATTTGLSWSDLAGASSWNPANSVLAIITCTNCDEWIKLVAANRGIGVVPDLARTRVPHPGVAYRDISDAPPSRVSVAWRARPVPPRSVQRFLGVLRPVNRCAEPVRRRR